MTDDGTSLDTGESTRRFGRAFLAAAVVLAVVLAAGVAPALGSVAGGTPLASLLPVSGAPSGSASGASSGSLSGNAAQLGALNAGSETSVGGNLASNDSAFRSLNAEVHFVVHSPQPAYWRTNAYTTYTGSGWDAPSNLSDYSEPVHERSAGTDLRYRVTLRQSATTLPTVWTPQSVNANTALEISATDGVVASSRVPAGTTYTGTSVQPPDNPSFLRSLGTDYPASIADTYTQLPSDTRRRLSPFVDNLTAGSGSAYESAKRIESWLESNKEYSLHVNKSPNGDVASQFVFNMNKGYCEYFATSMTAMLRTQGIPARYVVGYSTGEKTGPNEYTVRAMNAHAWVEVYFPDAGWVRFDPTPATERRQAESQALQNQTGKGYTSTTTPPSTTTGTRGTTGPTTPGTTSGTTRATTGGTTTTRTTTTTTSGTTTRTTTTTTTTTPNVNVSLNRTPAPGATVEVSVTRADSPIPDAVVYFNDERVGVTGENGTVVATVPYASELSVRVETPGGTTVASRGFGFGPGSTTRPDSSANYTMNTTASVTVLGRTVTGANVTVVATVDGVPVRDGAVRLNGTRVGTTNASGRAPVSLPREPGSVNLTVTRGPVTGSERLDLAGLSLDVDAATPLTLPGVPATVTATLNGSPASGVPVYVDGERVGTTDADGEFATTLPFAGSATFAAVRYGQRATATTNDLFVHAGLLAVGVLAVLAGGAYGLRRYGLTFRTAFRGLVAAAAGLARWLSNAVVVAAARVVAAVAHGVRSVVATLRGTITPRELYARFATWIATVRADVEGAISSVRERAAPDGQSDGAAESESYRTLREAWRDFLGATSVRDPARRTPTELARHAVERDDLPADAVVTVRDAFRAVEYGRRDPGERLDDVEAAMRDIEKRDEEDTGGGE